MKLICLFLFAICCIVVAEKITEPLCYWSGTAPICRGSCDTGEFVAATNSFGDGKTCLSGQKKYCCKMPIEWINQLQRLFAQFPDTHFTDY